jgi:hypothetical protein
MINAHPRFALDDEGNIYVYASGTNIAPVGAFSDDAGTWDLARLKVQILAGQPIETALNSLSSRTPAPPVDKVEQANEDFLSHQGAP